MKSLTITQKGATILHDGLVATSEDGNPVFILPANVAAPQLVVHPQGMIVYSVPEHEFPRYAEQLLRKKELTFRVRAAESDRSEAPQSQLQAHDLDLTFPDDVEFGTKAG